MQVRSKYQTDEKYRNYDLFFVIDARCRWV